MNILLCSKATLRPGLGTSQTLIGLGEALRERGHTVHYADPPKLRQYGRTPDEALAEYVALAPEPFDIIDAEYSMFSPPASRPTGTAFIARVQLLGAHQRSIRVPPVPRLRSRLRHALMRGQESRRVEAEYERARAVFQLADLVVVLNDWDQRVVEEAGVAPDAVVTVPNGLGPGVGALWELPEEPPQGPPRVAFVGSYGPRKGAADFPRIVARTAERVPNVEFLLLGTEGMCRTADEVLALFPRRLRSFVQVVPTFEREALAGHLATCAAGVYPTYWEAFGLGALEMMAAALPVVSYRAPGPTSFIPGPWTVALGDADGLADGLVRILTDRPALQAARARARAVTRDYKWERAAALTEAAYERAFCTLGQPT